jgi:hypothetical protein
MLERIRKIGWLAVEAALLLVVLCVLLHILLGSQSGSFIAGVAANALEFLKDVPSGTFLGVVLLLVLYWFYKNRS